VLEAGDDRTIRGGVNEGACERIAAECDEADRMRAQMIAATRRLRQFERLAEAANGTGGGVATRRAVEFMDQGCRAAVAFDQC
jgi:hypothetical protein